MRSDELNPERDKEAYEIEFCKPYFDSYAVTGAVMQAPTKSRDIFKADGNRAKPCLPHEPSLGRKIDKSVVKHTYAIKHTYASKMQREKWRMRRGVQERWELEAVLHSNATVKINVITEISAELSMPDGPTFRLLR